jgi:cell division protein FtsI/penicillin-binding protein 2
MALLGVVGAAVPFVALGQNAVAQRARERGATVSAVDAGAPASGRPRGAPVAITAVVAGLDPSRARPERGGDYAVDLPDGRRATLTLEPAWQRATAALLERHALPMASVVVLDTATGRVLVWASRGAPGRDLARAAEAPAASVFKIVTASALLGEGFSERTPTCWSGGFHALTLRNLASDPRRDRECSTLPEAFARSINTVFARRALELLNPGAIESTARQWGFGEAVPFDAPVAASEITVPSETLAFARTAAGFWNSTLSPLHGALLAQGIARGGEMTRPWIVSSIRGPQGETQAVGGEHAWRRAVSPEVAATLVRAMSRTVSEGTGFHGFHDGAGRAYLEGVNVGGKTGTLNATEPFRAFTWFVGNAEGAGRRLSIAVMVANEPLWRVKAPTLARQVLQIALRGRATD